MFDLFWTTCSIINEIKQLLKQSAYAEQALHHLKNIKLNRKMNVCSSELYENRELSIITLIKLRLLKQLAFSEHLIM
jgi:hypothetical protein